MTSSIAEAFRQFRSNLEITTLQESTTSTRQQNVRDAVASDFVVLETFLTGSYRRNTMIAPLSQADIDVFVVLDPKYYARDNQASLLEAIKTTLRKRYPETPRIKPDGQAVTITFADFKVDVVPGFHRKGGGYLIPDARKRRWIETDPKRHVELWTASNKEHDGHLVPLIKMMKCWNRTNGELFSSFHLEVLILQSLNGVKITDFPSGVRWLLDNMRGRVWTKIADPAGYGDDVAPNLTRVEADRMIAAMTRSLRSAVAAETYGNLGYVRTAIDEWKNVFGGYFPG